MRTQHKNILRNTPIKTWSELDSDERSSILIASSLPTIYASLPLAYLPKEVLTIVIDALFQTYH